MCSTPKGITGAGHSSWAAGLPRSLRDSCCSTPKAITGSGTVLQAITELVARSPLVLNAEGHHGVGHNRGQSRRAESSRRTVDVLNAEGHHGVGARGGSAIKSPRAQASRLWCSTPKGITGAGTPHAMSNSAGSRRGLSCSKTGEGHQPGSGTFGPRAASRWRHLCRAQRRRASRGRGTSALHDGERLGLAGAVLNAEGHHGGRARAIALIGPAGLWPACSTPKGITGGGHCRDQPRDVDELSLWQA